MVPTKVSTQNANNKLALRYVEVLAGYSEDEIEQVQRFADKGISESEWKTLKLAGELPEHARPGINAIINSYWEWRSDNFIPSSLPPKINRVATDCMQLRASLSELRNNRDYFKGVHAYYEKSPIEQSAFFEDIIDRLQKLELLLESARQRIKEPPFRPSHRSMFMALRELQYALQLWNMKMSDDQNGLAYRVLRLTDPKLTKRVIRAAIKEFLAISQVWDWTGMWVEHEHR